MVDSPSNKLSQQVEREVRQHIGELQMQVIVLRQMIELEQQNKLQGQQPGPQPSPVPQPDPQPQPPQPVPSQPGQPHSERAANGARPLRGV